MQKKGYVSFVLHAHLPFIHHPESDDYLEESWLYEAISETYLPLLKYFKMLVDEKVNFRITMSMTPPLLSMLDSKLLQQKYIKYLENLIELSEKEIKRTTFNQKMNNLSHYYYERYSEDLRLYRDVFNCDIISQFKHFQDIGVLEIITCGATHGYFPILYVNEKTVRAQIAVGVQTYERFFGRKPRGIWLPECGYVPEADKYLREFGLDYAIVESHGVLYANPTPIYGTLAPIVSPDGFTVFGRDMESSRQVWSSINGYPGDFNYRDFYKDIGYETDYEYIKPYIAHNGVRVHTGIKYHRITGKTDSKDIYDVQWAMDSAEKQAGHFLNSRTNQIENASKYMDKPPIVLCPYDAELYGHWWYEGPYWLYILFKKIYYDECNFELITPSEYIDRYPLIQQCTPCRSSWGANGYSEVWLNPSNDYAHKHLHKAGDRMCELAYNFRNVKTDLDKLEYEISELKKQKKSVTKITSTKKYKDLKLQFRALNQAARELLLLQSSDWLFIITNNTMVDYAHRRIKDHTGRFTRLYNELNSGKIDKKFLEEIEAKDAIFPDIDYRIYL
ncbi:MAG: DUF1957 domain-containing protein [Clostridia bacterium]|nr:DUF1957 domain-containing protein [Clostridia bacterium]